MKTFSVKFIYTEIMAEKSQQHNNIQTEACVTEYLLLSFL